MGFAVGGMQFVKGRPTYKLLPGTVGESFAMAVAEKLELPQKVIDRANELAESNSPENVGMALLFAASRYNAHVVSQHAQTLGFRPWGSQLHGDAPGPYGNPPVAGGHGQTRGPLAGA